MKELNKNELMGVDGGSGWGDLVHFLGWYYEFAKDYVEFGKQNNDIVEVGANCM